MLGAQRGSRIATLTPKYIPYSYMDPVGNGSLQGMDKMEASV